VTKQADTGTPVKVIPATAHRYLDNAAHITY